MLDAKTDPAASATGGDDHRGPVVDATGLICPMPVLRARKALLELSPGVVLTVLATDQAARQDFTVFCEATGHALLGIDEQDGVLTIRIRRSA